MSNQRAAFPTSQNQITEPRLQPAMTRTPARGFKLILTANVLAGYRAVGLFLTSGRRKRRPGPLGKRTRFPVERAPLPASAAGHGGPARWENRGDFQWSGRPCPLRHCFVARRPAGSPWFLAKSVFVDLELPPQRAWDPASAVPAPFRVIGLDHRREPFAG